MLFYGKQYLFHLSSFSSATLSEMYELSRGIQKDFSPTVKYYRISLFWTNYAEKLINLAFSQPSHLYRSNKTFFFPLEIQFYTMSFKNSLPRCVLFSFQHSLDAKLQQFLHTYSNFVAKMTIHLFTSDIIKAGPVKNKGDRMNSEVRTRFTLLMLIWCSKGYGYISWAFYLDGYSVSKMRMNV